MNFLAHVLVAAESGDGTPEAALGAALPDLARMAGVRFDRDALPPLVRQGIDSHHRADSCFHADRTFLTGAEALRSAGRRRGLPVGASRAVGHAGWELLLDGALLGVPELVDRFLAATDCADTVVPTLDPADRASWAGLVASLRTDRWWLRYDEPALVAESLFRMVR
ncbi:MAG TPA: hypothetical protein VHW47_04885, partial [Acidimicrobiales bacterium]|nr:hypothetical protein [Acidimicrobiales bacterium]